MVTLQKTRSMNVLQHVCSFLTAAACFILFNSCSASPSQVKYRIGVSQCSADIWRDKQNDELRMAAYLNNQVELCFSSAYDSDEVQIHQIDSLVQAGIDLLIVAPNQLATISPAIDRAFDKGVPVIVFERKTSSKKYTAYIGADNYEMGRTMGEHIAMQLKGQGHVVEVMGLKGSSPAIERHNGFMDALKRHPGITVTATLQGDWTEESAREAALNANLNLHEIDAVFAHNDRMAMGVRKVFEQTSPQSNIRYYGIDGLTGAQGGIQLVRDSLLDATYIYPTRGDLLLELALNILKGKPYTKEVKLQSALVTHDNANVVLLQSHEIERQSEFLQQLHQRADSYLNEINYQRTITLLALGVILLLLIAIALFYRYHRGQVTLRRERVFNTLWNMPEETTPASTEQAPTLSANEEKTEAVSPTVSEGEGVEPQQEEVKNNQTENEPTIQLPQEEGPGSNFIARFRKVVDARMNESDTSVEDLAADMHLSRVQLYRKVKSITGSSPVELLRTARLNRAYQLLLATDLTVAEVAYRVGFSSPSYFTKCFKETYGKLPNQVMVG